MRRLVAVMVVLGSLAFAAPAQASDVSLVLDFAAEEGSSGGLAAVNLAAVQVSPVSAQDVTVTYTIADGTATTADGDYSAATVPVTIPAGNAFWPLPVSVNGDTVAEDHESVTVTLTGATSFSLTHTLGTSSADATILNDDFWPVCGFVTTECVSAFTGGGATTLEVFPAGGGSAVQIQLRNAGDYELSPALTPSSTVHIELNLGTHDPVGFMATGLVSAYTTTVGGGNYALSLDIQPRASSWLFFGCDSLDCGIPTTPADIDYASLLLAVAFDIPGAPVAAKDAFRGSYVSTNAQQFSFDGFDPVTSAVKFTLAAPHFKVGGVVVNTGFVRMFLRDGVLTDFLGISDPNSVNTGTFDVEKTSGGITTDIPFSVTRVSTPPTGVLIEAGTGGLLTPFEFSTPTFAVKKASSGGGGGGDSSGGSGGSSGGGATTPPAIPPATPLAPAAPAAPPAPTVGTPFVGSDAADVFSLGNGGFILTTGGGSDVVRTGSGADRVALGTGNDVALLGAGNDRAFGGPGNDVLMGGAGDDHLVGGPGIDRLVGGSGDDVLDLRDGRPGDRAACGLGRDVVYADRGDRIARDCEVIRWR